MDEFEQLKDFILEQVYIALLDIYKDIPDEVQKQVGLKILRAGSREELRQVLIAVGLYWPPLVRKTFDLAMYASGREHIEAARPENIPAWMRNDPPWWEDVELRQEPEEPPPPPVAEQLPPPEEKPQESTAPAIEPPKEKPKEKEEKPNMTFAEWWDSF